MKKLLVLWSLLLLPLLAMAQEAYDVIYLNNGNIVKGQIISSSDSKVQIRATNGEEYSFDRVAIRRIDNGEQLNMIPKAPKSQFVDHSESVKGFWAAADLLGGVSVDHDSAIKSTFPVELQITFGYRFSEFLQVGVGAGFRHYIDNKMARCYHNDKKEWENYGWSFPIYGQARGLFYSGQSRTVVPFWQMTVGHSINDGFMLSPGLGLRFGSRERHHFNLGIGYTAQWTRLYNDDPTAGSCHKFGALHILQLRVGYQF